MRTARRTAVRSARLRNMRAIIRRARRITRTSASAPPVKPASTKRVVDDPGRRSASCSSRLLVSSFLPRRATSRELEAEVAGRRRAAEVQTTQVVQAATGGDLTLPGTIQPLHEGAIYARVGGYVRKWHADIGRVVHAGDVLAEIDAPELEQQVEQAQQQLAQTRAALGLAKADLARWQVARRRQRREPRGARSEDRGVRRGRREQRRGGGESAASDRDAALHQSHRAVQRRDHRAQRRSRLADHAAGATSAPITAGGAGVPGAGSLFRIAQTDTVRMYISVPQADALSMTAGMTADVTVQELPNRKFTGHVVRTSAALDASSRTLLTEVDIVNPGMTLLSGMYAQVHRPFDASRRRR